MDVFVICWIKVENMVDIGKIIIINGDLEFGW